MPKQGSHLRVVRQWCQSLGVLSAVSISRDEAEIKLAAFVPMLMSRFPNAAFTSDSLEYCAAQCVKGFPTYGELIGWLSDWWRDNRPTPPALPAPTLPWQRPDPPRPPPTLEEVEAVHRAAETAIAALRSSAQPVEDYRGPRAAYLSDGVLDQLNPLPNGRTRTHGETL